MPKAKARHLLVKTKEECQKVKEEIENGLDFAQAAKKYSKCPSKQQGGDMGEFGYHLIEVTSRG